MAFTIRQPLFEWCSAAVHCVCARTITFDTSHLNIHSCLIIGLIVLTLYVRFVLMYIYLYKHYAYAANVGFFLVRSHARYVTASLTCDGQASKNAYQKTITIVCPDKQLKAKHAYHRLYVRALTVNAMCFCVWTLMMFLLAPFKPRGWQGHKISKPPHRFDWGLSFFQTDWHLIYSMYTTIVFALNLQLGKHNGMPGWSLLNHQQCTKATQ